MISLQVHVSQEIAYKNCGSTRSTNVTFVFSNDRLTQEPCGLECAELSIFALDPEWIQTDLLPISRMQIFLPRIALDPCVLLPWEVFPFHLNDQ